MSWFDTRYLIVHFALFYCPTLLCFCVTGCIRWLNWLFHFTPNWQSL